MKPRWRWTWGAALAGVFALTCLHPAAAAGQSGTCVRSVTQLVADGGRAAWSHDGERIAFDRPGMDGYADVSVMKLGGPDLLPLTAGRPGVPQKHNGNPAWHPSGRYIVFQAEDPDLPEPGDGLLGRFLASPGVGVNSNVWLARADGSQFWQLTHVVGGHGTLHPQFSPDGKQLLWSELVSPVSGGTGQWAIKLADLDLESDDARLRNVRTLSPLGLQLYETHGFSPDGQCILFSGIEQGGFYYDMEIYSMNLSDGAVTRLTENDEWDEHAHFSPDGRRIVWASSEGIRQPKARTWDELLATPPKLDYWVMDADGANKRRVSGFNDPEAPEYMDVPRGVIAADFDWSPDGTSIVARLQKGRGREAVYLVRFDFATPGLASAPTDYKSDAGPHEVAVVRYDWQDARRQRPVPAKIYYPADGEGPFPVIIFSHGAGGSREGYEYLGRHWASYGYVSVHLQHVGSDEAVWRGRPDSLAGIRESVADPRNALERPRDVTFAIDRLTEMERTDLALKGRLDLDRIGVAGHSFGAWTALAVAGETFVLPGGRTVDFRDARVRAAVAMSAPVPRRRGHAAQAFGSIRIPCLHMTGTLDESIVGDTKAAERRIPYDDIHGADQYLVTFIGGDHMVFSGRGDLPPARNDKLFQGFVLQGTTAFWDAYLRGDERAKAWLTEGGYATVLGDDAVYEHKSP